MHYVMENLSKVVREELATLTTECELVKLKDMRKVCELVRAKD